jgi:hypothetical protein
MKLLYDIYNFIIIDFYYFLIFNIKYLYKILLIINKLLMN